MSTLVNQLTVEQAHKEFTSLADKIAAKYEQLDSHEFGAVGNPPFNAMSTELQVSLLVWANFVIDWTCQCPQNFTGCHSSSIEEHNYDITTLHSDWFTHCHKMLDEDWRLVQ